ncbi:MAG: hypothetical protein HYX68_19615 [Planctomycetes bacterium]|jgi:membrane-bound ClpP family serine protease|nr:hypothetical protein [Planctomycetota bacterium]
MDSPAEARARMYLIATDILADLCGLSLGLILAILPIGLLLWLLGWWSHRFWIVLATTVVAGLFGLLEANTWHAQPIVVAILLAIAAGVLALALVRVITFAAGGLAGVYALLLAFPSFQHQVIAFLVSGLLCLLLFRWFFMLLTSLVGVCFLAYGVLALMHYREMMDAITWSDENSTLLTAICGGGALFGFGFQFFFDRWRARRRRERDEDGDEDMISMLLSRLTFRRRRD